MKITVSHQQTVPASVIVHTNAPVKIAEPNQAQRHASIAAQRGGGIPWSTHNAQTDDQAQVEHPVGSGKKPPETAADY